MDYHINKLIAIVIVLVVLIVFICYINKQYTTTYSSVLVKNNTEDYLVVKNYDKNIFFKLWTTRDVYLGPKYLGKIIGSHKKTNLTWLFLDKPIIGNYMGKVVNIVQHT